MEEREYKLMFHNVITFNWITTAILENYSEFSTARKKSVVFFKYLDKSTNLQPVETILGKFQTISNDKYLKFN